MTWWGWWFRRLIGVITLQMVKISLKLIYIASGWLDHTTQHLGMNDPLTLDPCADLVSFLAQTRQ